MGVGPGESPSAKPRGLGEPAGCLQAGQRPCLSSRVSGRPQGMRTGPSFSVSSFSSPLAPGTGRSPRLTVCGHLSRWPALVTCTHWWDGPMEGARAGGPGHCKAGTAAATHGVPSNVLRESQLMEALQPPNTGFPVPISQSGKLGLGGTSSAQGCQDPNPCFTELESAKLASWQQRAQAGFFPGCTPSANGHLAARCQQVLGGVAAG